MRSVIKKEHVRLAEGPPPTEHPDVRPDGSQPARCAPVPGVRLVRLDGRVQAIEVTCRCGEVTVLDLEYGDAPATGDDPEETR
jgi:hypothetical protein